MIKKGIYKHYKGGLYEVVGSGLIEATHVPAVFYRSLKPNDVSEFWIRPEKEFFEQVTFKGSFVRRFEFFKSK